MNVRLFATLRDLLGTKSIEISVERPTAVRQVLEMIVESHPALGPKLWDAEGRLTGYLTVLLNGRSIEYLSGLDTSVDDTDNISLFPPVGGG